MVSKPRDIFIYLARQLFALKGIANTTMNDIAEASDKGRRTIYTYFKNKREIYNAVVQSESSQMLARLQELLKQPLTPEQKLMNFIFIRFESVKEIVLRNGSLRAGFFRDVRKVERARRSTSAQEFSILKQILSEGVQKGMFRIKHIDQTTTIMLYSLHGLDVPYIRNDFSEMGIERMTLREYIRDFIMNGIKKQ